ncbi:polysaccharide deacetylase family protein [Parvularcula marina]|uniref:Polysaccharide deacetylase n=1 Tax=Parvularcula marina TaxID=2292771 RepID=A0A371RI38_9PROT|nr:polysaccharide deacetylase family protein [Parvularcula marina]RFB05113.1 polysaccharide deacetylase [Parvularcula marina]
MTLPDDYLKYPKRQHGMDHDLYPWSNLFDRKPVSWPEGAGVALWITISGEFFPLTPNTGPLRAPGHMATPYPDFRTFTTRDYGNRVGMYRIMKVLDSLGLSASVNMSSDLTTRAPMLVEEFKSRNWEIIAHARNMNDVVHGETPEDTEQDIIDRTLDDLSNNAGIIPKGWMSPARSESYATPSLLAQSGLEYVCDWGNDDMPYLMTTEGGPIHAMPYTHELEDRHVLQNLGQREEVYIEQIIAAFDRLSAEAKDHGGRVLHLALTPYIIGQPFRIWALKEVLNRILEKGAVWNATGEEILSAWQNAQTPETA